LRFYSSVRLGVQRMNLVKGTFGTDGTKVKVTSVKNKVAPPVRACEAHLVYGRGFVPGQNTGASSSWK
jgi:recombination protein RecA